MSDDKLNLPAIPKGKKKKGRGGLIQSQGAIRPSFDLEKNAAVSKILKSDKPTLRQEIDQREQGLDLVLVGDLTGSMRSYHTLLKEQFTSLSRDLFQMIKNIRIGIIFYLDHGSDDPYVTAPLQLSKDIDEMQRFISATSTGYGGDEDEAVEDAFYDIVNLNWRQTGSRSVVLFGDACPHEPHECPNQHSYFDLVKKMHDMNIVVNSVFCGDQHGQSASALQKLHDVDVGDFEKRVERLAPPNFFSWVANVTGGMIIGIDQINDLIDIIKAAAAKDAGEMEKYEESLAHKPEKLNLVSIAKKAEKRRRLAHEKQQRLGYKKP